MNKNKGEITDIEVDGNTVRFKKLKGAIKVKVRVPMVKGRKGEEAHELTDDKIKQIKAMEEGVLYRIEHPEEWEE